MKSLGSTLKQSRDLVAMTLREVEEKAGISNAYLSQLENDKIKKPSASVLYKLSALYKIDLNSLLSAAGVIDKSDDSQHVETKQTKNEWEKRISFYTEKLSEEQKGKILEYIQFLKSNG